MPNTSVTPPRVPMVDPVTGIVSREWYKFFLDLSGNGVNTISLMDLQQAPPTVPSSGWTPPIGMVAFFPETSTPPPGWVEYTPLRSRFPRGMPSGGTPGATGGSTTTSVESGDNVYDLQTGTTFTPTVPQANHTHTVTPPYVDGLWCKYTG